MDKDDSTIIKLIIEILAKIKVNILVKQHKKIIYQKKKQNSLNNINNSNPTMKINIFTIESERLKHRGLSYQSSKIITLSQLRNSGLSYLKQLLFKRGLKDSYLILDTDDRDNINLANNNGINKVIYCSSSGENILIKKQLKAGRPAVYIKGDNLVIFDGEDELPILAIYRLFNLSKKVELFSIKNYLFIVAFAFVYGVPLYIIRSFFCNYSQMTEENLQVIYYKSNNKKEFIIK
jgi:hypothetical protein